MQAPSLPGGLVVASVSGSQVSVSWAASTDNVGVSSYGGYLDGVLVGSTTGTAYTFSGLSCGTSHQIAVDAVDAAGNRSGKASLTTATAACPSAPASSTAQVFVSPTGNNATCVRGNASLACASFDRADAIAQSGDTIQVAPGTYQAGPLDPDGYGYTTFVDHSTAATYVCQPGAAADSVSFADPIFLFDRASANITFDGSCFHFHEVAVGLNAPGQPTNIVLDGVHMDTFEIMGAADVTIENSQIGPIDACYGPNDPSAPSAQSKCDPSNPTEAYWAALNGGRSGTNGVQAEPFVHSNGYETATNITLSDDHFVGMQTRYSSELHQGGLLVWGVNGLTINGSTFDHDAIYDIEFNQNSNDSNVAITNNVFGWSVYPLDGSTTDGLETPDSYRDVTLTWGQGGTGSLTNALIEGNRFAHGLLPENVVYGGTTYSNVQITGNILGQANVCETAPGVTYSHNVTWSADGSPCSGINDTTTPYANYTALNFTITNPANATYLTP